MGCREGKRPHRPPFLLGLMQSKGAEREGPERPRLIWGRGAKRGATLPLKDGTSLPRLSVRSGLVLGARGPEAESPLFSRERRRLAKGTG